MTTEFTAYLVLSLLCALINIAPAVSHLIQGHSGPASFGIWVVILNMLGFVGSDLFNYQVIVIRAHIRDVTGQWSFVDRRCARQGSDFLRRLCQGKSGRNLSSTRTALLSF
jgi:hypothetical protein